MNLNRPFLKHIVLEVFGTPLKIKKYEDAENSLLQFSKLCNLTILFKAGHNFTPYGFTRVYVLSESHIIFHSWPENKYLNIDLLSCKKILSTNKIRVITQKVFKTNKVKVRSVKY